jgi:putative transposase
MGQSLSQVYIHETFSTKDRRPLITGDLRDELYRYTATVLKGLGCPAVEIGGAEDHVHILHRLSRTTSIAQVMEGVKKPTSRWMKGRGAGYGAFEWQPGYGAFSVSASLVPKVQAYIQNQEAHHKRQTFQDELRGLLRRHGIAYDELHLWT